MLPSPSGLRLWLRLLGPLILGLLLCSCEEEWIRMELTRDIPGYEAVLADLFRVEARQDSPASYRIRAPAEGSERRTGRLLALAGRLPYVRAIGGKEIQHRSIKAEREEQRVFLRYEKGLAEERIRHFEVFWDLGQRQDRLIIGGYSYLLPAGVEPSLMKGYLDLFPFVIHLEEDRPVKAF